MTLRLVGIGTSTPPQQISQNDAISMVQHFGCSTDRQREFLRAIYLTSGIKTRSSVLLQPPDEKGVSRQTFFQPATEPLDRGPTTGERIEQYCKHAPDMAEVASVVAIKESAVRPSEFTHLVTVSCTGFHAPGFDIQLIERLSLAPQIARTNVGYMGCHGGLNALRVANAYIRSDPRAVVLLVAVELCSLHLQYGPEPQKIISHALFADGAAALVATGDRGESDAWRLQANGSCVLANSQQDMCWRIGDHGFEMSLSPRVPELIAANLRPWLSAWLDSLALSISDIQSWAIHPGGPKILSACSQALELSRDDLRPSEAVLSEHGNMSSPTIFFVLQRMRAAQAARPCVAIGFGPGLCFEAALWV